MSSEYFFLKTNMDLYPDTLKSWKSIEIWGRKILNFGCSCRYSVPLPNDMSGILHPSQKRCQELCTPPIVSIRNSLRILYPRVPWRMNWNWPYTGRPNKARKELTPGIYPPQSLKLNAFDILNRFKWAQIKSALSSHSYCGPDFMSIEKLRFRAPVQPARSPPLRARLSLFRGPRGYRIPRIG